MADYRPLVERLVSNLPEQDAAARASAYDRARAALESQFGGDPEDAERFEAERLALAGAIAVVEAELSAEELSPAETYEERLVDHDEVTIAPPQSPPAPNELQGVYGVPGRTKDGASPARISSRAAMLALAACVLCALLIGVGALGWRLSYGHGHAAVAAEDDAEVDDDRQGAAVPAPVGSLGPAVADDTPPGIVTQRAALLVDAPRDPQRLKTYTGRVEWRFIRPEQATGQAGTAKVQADVEIPEAGLRAEFILDKNVAPGLSASHVAQVRFVRQDGSPIGSIDQIAMPEMRAADALTGDPLVGSLAKVTDDVFLIGLSDYDRKTTNLRLIQSRPWIDLPILIQGHHEAKLTFEKGTTGDAVWAEALATWR